MAKETLYFTHDFGARNDPKMINLQIKHGMLGIGCYWCIVEILNEQGGEIPLEYERIGFELRVDTNVLKSVINDFDLFIIDDKILSSKSVLRRIEIRQSKSTKARESVSKRWEKDIKNTNVFKNDTNVSKNDTIKERKERKENKYNKEEKDECGVEVINNHPVYQTPNKSDFIFSYEETKLDFEKSVQWLEVVAMQTGYTKEYVLSDGLKFIDDLNFQGKFPRNISDTKSYFANSIKKRSISDRQSRSRQSKIPMI